MSNLTTPSGDSPFGFDRQSGLATVHEFMTLEREVDARCRAHGEVYGIVLVDIEGLRGINKTHGFDFGDRVLVQMAHRLRAAFAAEPPRCIARVGGDEFAVLFDRIDAVVSLSQLARKIRLDVAGQPLVFEETRLRLQLRTTFRRGPRRKPVASDLLWEVQWADRIESTRELHQRLEWLELRDGQLAGQAGDLRDRLAAAQQRAMLALYDPLTAVRNRRGLTEIMTSLSAPRILAFVDVDNLRDLNGLDDQNWDAGDQALIGVAGLLQTISEGTIVVRWGGDEFLVIVPDVAVTEVVDALEALIQRARAELRFGGVEVTFSARRRRVQRIRRPGGRGSGGAKSCQRGQVVRQGIRGRRRQALNAIASSNLRPQRCTDACSE
jgi:diguanylate cyclase (GGDEF)-like protein